MRVRHIQNGFFAAASIAVLAGTLPAWGQAESASLPTCDEIDPPYFHETEQGELVLYCSGMRAYDPILVYGDRSYMQPGSVATLEEEAIAETLADHPAEILNTLPGVNIQMNSGQEHLIAIRSPVLTGGAGQGSFLILENGVPTRSPAFGNVNSLFEPHHEVASAIEVVRGPGSAKYGSNAVHGLVNVILPDVGGGSQAVASYGSLGRWRTDVTHDEGRNWLAAVSLQHDNGWRDNTGIDQQKLTLVGEWDPGAWTSTAWLTASNLNQETGGFIQGVDAYKSEDIAKTNPNPEAYRDAWSARLGARFSRPVGGGELTLTPYAHTQAMIFAQHFLPYSGTEKNDHAGGGLMARYQWEATDKVTLRIGGDADIASGSLKETQSRPTFGFNPANDQFPQGKHYDYTVDTLMGALWGEAEIALSDDVRVLAGLRAETHEYDYSTEIPAGINGRFNVPADREDNFDLLTPKLGLIWSATGDLDLYANYARGQRAPQASDLYRLQNLQVAGEVEEETLDSFEIGARGNALDGRFVFDVAAYWMEKENFFFRDSDGLNVPDGATEHKGVEFAGAFDISDTLSLSGTLSWSDQTYTFDRITGSSTETIRDGNVIDTAPEWLAHAALDWQASDAVKLSLTMDHVGEYFTDPANTTTYPGHTVFGARGAWSFAEDMELFLIIRNLTDERYADRADLAFGNERYFPGEPVNATLGFRRRY